MGASAAGGSDGGRPNPDDTRREFRKQAVKTSKISCSTNKAQQASRTGDAEVLNFHEARRGPQQPCGGGESRRPDAKDARQDQAKSPGAQVKTAEKRRSRPTSKKELAKRAVKISRNRKVKTAEKRRSRPTSEKKELANRAVKTSRNRQDKKDQNRKEVDQRRGMKVEERVPQECDLDDCSAERETRQGRKEKVQHEVAARRCVKCSKGEPPRDAKAVLARHTRSIKSTRRSQASKPERSWSLDQTRGRASKTQGKTRIKADK